MTIPRIGNKIVRVKASQPTAPAPSVEPSVQEVNIENFEDASLDEMFDNAEPEPAPAGINPADVPSFEPENARHPEESYSIEKFTQDYMEKLNNDVLPLLEQYEPERRQRFFLAMLCSGSCWIAALLALILVDGNTLNIVGGFIALGGFAWFLLKKQLEKKIKNRVMPLLMKAVPDFSWQSELSIPEEDIEDSKIFPFVKEGTKKYDDNFVGKYREVDISIAECNLVANKRNIFSGAIIKIATNKDFDGTTIIRPKKEVEYHDVKDLKKARYQKIELEDVEFNKMYDVYSTDQIEARYLLTTAFIERFRNINMAFDTKVAYCAFFGKNVYIAPYCKKDLFSVCSLTKSVADVNQFTKLFSEFTSILALVDHFKLDKKLGL